MTVKLNVQMVKIPVSDIARAVPFYRDVLGLSEDFVMADYGWAQLRAGNLPIALYVPSMGGGNGAVGQTDFVHFITSHVEEFREQLHNANIDPDKHLHTGDDNSQYFELSDPDGNTFKIMLQMTED